MFYFVYKTTIVPVNRWYFGIHKSWDKDWSTTDATDPFCGSHSDIVNWIKARGRSQIVIEVLRVCYDIGEANRELQKYQPTPKFTEEHKAKLSIANSGANNGFYGATHTPEVVKQLSEYRKGIKWINNGQVEKQIGKDEPIPDGWFAKRLKRKKT